MLFVSMVNSLLPIRKRTILFKSFSGQYSDSPRVISEYIHANYPDIHIVWAKSEANNNRGYLIVNESQLFVLISLIDSQFSSSPNK